MIQIMTQIWHAYPLSVVFVLVGLAIAILSRNDLLELEIPGHFKFRWDRRQLPPSSKE